MKLYIEIPSGRNLLINSTPNSGALLQALTEAVLVNEQGYGDNKKYIIEPSDQITVKVMSDDFIAEPSDPIKILRKEKEASDSRWMEYYSKHNKLESQLKELYSDLDSRGITYQKPETK